ncbi:hypothetical protein PHISP_04270 [Aspergillus sp. HF37]|nr:hypothetical protein PHISP_04270 [Aspergillus sp. HF37]
MPDHNPDKHDSDSISIGPGLHASQPGPASRSSSYNYNYRSHNTTPLSMQNSSLQTRPADTPDRAPNSRTRLLPSQPQRFSSASSSGNSVSMTGPHEHAHPAQTSMPAIAIAPALPRRWSRLPTPTYQPNGGDGGYSYSHEMYKREGRRGVISSLGRKCTTRLRRAASGVVMPQESTSSSKRVTSDSAVITVQRSSPSNSQVGLAPAPKSRLRIPSNNTGSRSRRRTMLPLPLLQTQTHPKSGSTSTLSLLPSQTTKTSAVETTTELLGSRSSSPDDEWPLPHAVPVPQPRSKRPGPRPSLRKVRVKLHSLSLPQRHDDDEPSTAAGTGAGTEYSPHRELSSTFARIKDEIAPRKMWAQNGPQLGFRAARDGKNNNNNNNNNNNIGGSGVRAFAFERMENQRGAVSSKTKTGFSLGSAQFSAGSVASRGGRMSRDRDPSERMVSEAKPKHYWLGRFVTLTNAFHYEDSFSEPDVATGFGMLSSYSFPAKDDADRPGYRVRRAFMVLENVCVTDEASWSFRRFRDEYVARYGRLIGY